MAVAMSMCLLAWLIVLVPEICRIAWGKPLEGNADKSGMNNQTIWLGKSHLLKLPSCHAKRTA